MLTYLTDIMFPKENATMLEAEPVEWAQLMGLLTMAEEGEILTLEAISALDFTHLGLFPDTTKAWHEQNQLPVGS